MPEHRTLLFVILMCAIASFIPCLWLPITGEEGVFATGAYEALQHHQWTHPTLFGFSDWRPPLYQWLNITLFYTEGQTSMLLAMRRVTLLATLLSTLSLMWLSHTLYPKRSLTILTAACYLSGDVLLRRGWIAYSDPTFAAFTFLAISCLWISLETQRRILIPLAGIALTLAFLSKAITAYVFYGVFLLNLAYFHPNRKQLLTPISIFSHLAAISVYLYWSLQILPAHGSGLIIDLTRHFQEFNLWEYLAKITAFPLHVVLQTFPASLVALFIWQQSDSIQLTQNDKIALTTVGINLLPYWFSSHAGATRYILPMIPLLILFYSHLIFRQQARIKELFYGVLALMILLKLMYVGLFIPNYHTQQHGDFAAIAQDVLSRTNNQPILVTDSDYIGYAVGTHLDQLLYPHKVITAQQPNQASYYVLETVTNAQSGVLIADYAFGNHHLYLRRLG